MRRLLKKQRHVQNILHKLRKVWSEEIWKQKIKRLVEEESVVVRKETLRITDRLFMGQFLISNKDRGTIVTPSQPHTGTEVQVQNTHRDEVKTHGTHS